MNLYLIERPDEGGYDTYSAAVVAAKSPRNATLIHPSGDKWAKAPDWAEHDFCWMSEHGFTDNGSWVTPDRVKLTLIGVAESGPERVICASYHAG